MPFTTDVAAENAASIQREESMRHAWLAGLLLIGCAGDDDGAVSDGGADSAVWPGYMRYTCTCITPTRVVPNLEACQGLRPAAEAEAGLMVPECADTAATGDPLCDCTCEELEGGCAR